MTYDCRVFVSYDDRPTRLDHVRAMDAQHQTLQETCVQSEQLWLQGSQSADERRDACTAVAVAMTTFAMNSGVPFYAQERVNDLLVGLNELQCGRNSVLLVPSSAHSSSFSVSDLMQQALAQVCVDLFRDAGASASEARHSVARLFEKHQLPRFGESKLRTLTTRLKGRGSTQDPAFDVYQWAKTYVEQRARELGLWPVSNVPRANKLADILIRFAKNRDHRGNFFFAPREDGSELP